LPLNVSKSGKSRHVFINCQAKKNYSSGNAIKIRKVVVETVVEVNDFLNGNVWMRLKLNVQQ